MSALMLWSLVVRACIRWVIVGDCFKQFATTFIITNKSTIMQAVREMRDIKCEAEFSPLPICAQQDSV